MKLEEKGALVVEATFVFPIMFFVLFFLIYMGNMFYMRSRVDAITTEYAVRGAAYCVDPYLQKIYEKGSVPEEIDDIRPYHSVLGSTPFVNDLREDMRKRLEGLGNGYFSGMSLKSIAIDMLYKRGLFTSTFSVDVSYRIKFAIRFMGDEEPTILLIHSQVTVPVTDTPEFISNVDMAMDFFDSSGLSRKLGELRSKVSQFFDH